ncbi:MAG TPA: hypothetical protein VGS19_18370, partial [Streptosporangiaceae bacterium]|nr:hypothetical protein [Streptosporangiaceae bacterium]
WYDTGHEGTPSEEWYRLAAQRQQQRHNYHHVRACGDCAIRSICDGFHTQYTTRWGGGEARPYPGTRISDPHHFIAGQRKRDYVIPDEAASREMSPPEGGGRMAGQLTLEGSGGAADRHTKPARR